MSENANKNNAVNIAIQYLERAYNIQKNSIYTEHIPYMINNKLYLYSKDKNSTTTKEYEYDNKPEENGQYSLSKSIVDRYKRQLRPHLQVCREFSSYFFNEKIDFKLADAEDDKEKAILETEYLKKHYNDKDLWKRLENEMVDVFGVGAVGIVSSYDEVWGIQNSFYDAYCILPLTIIDNQIKEVAFIGTDVIDNQKTRISLHRINWTTDTFLTDEPIPQVLTTKKENGYIIDTITLDQSGNMIEAESLLNRISPVRLFVIFKPFNRKSYEYANCFGVPIYEDSKDICQGIDNIYDAMAKDLAISQNMLLVSKNLFTDPINNKLEIPERFANGNTILLGEENANSTDNKAMVSLENLQTKINEYSQNLTEAYKMLSLSVGLGAETLSLNKVSTPTATQVISDNGQKFNTLKKHFGQIRDEICRLNSAILFLAYENTNNKQLDYNVRITFNTSDNILVDDETLKEQALSQFQAGLMSAYRFLKEYENLTGQDLIDELERLGYDENGKKTSNNDFNNLFGNMNNDNDNNKDDNDNDDLSTNDNKSNKKNTNDNNKDNDLNKDNNKGGKVNNE